MNRGFLGAFLMVGLLASGCSSSSSGNPDGLAESFMGHWEIEGTTSSFSLTCPAQMIGPVAFPIWSELELDHGVLSDLVDVSNACAPPGINFQIDPKGVTATAMNPDPYTNTAPLCQLVVAQDSNGLPIFIDFSFSALTITKLQSTGSGQAPRVLYGGTAMGPLMQDNGTGTGTNETIDTCTYSGAGDIFHRTTQP